MYLTSKKLKDRINEVAGAVFERSGGRIRFEEYIALPEHGQIVLRFDFTGEPPRADELDRFEAMLRGSAGEDFLVDFMGRVYKSAGIDYQMLDAILRRCAALFCDERMPESVFAKYIRQDAVYLLGLCGLPFGTPVWEIQVEDEIELLLLGSGSSGAVGRFNGGGLVVNLGAAEEEPSNGLIRAAFYAKRTGRSIASVLLDVQNSLLSAGSQSCSE